MVQEYEKKTSALQSVCRGVRGATVAAANTPEAILAATGELLDAIVAANDIAIDDIASILFTTTVDLNAVYPALAARQRGWLDTALLCGQEIEVPGGMPRCIRVLLHWNTGVHPTDIQHIYLGDAQRLRPDRSLAALSGTGRIPATNGAVANGTPA